MFVLNVILFVVTSFHWISVYVLSLDLFLRAVKAVIGFVFTCSHCHASLHMFVLNVCLDLSLRAVTGVIGLVMSFDLFLRAVIGLVFTCFHWICFYVLSLDLWSLSCVIGFVCT